VRKLGISLGKALKHLLFIHIETITNLLRLLRRRDISDQYEQHTRDSAKA